MYLYQYFAFVTDGIGNIGPDETFVIFADKHCFHPGAAFLLAYRINRVIELLILFSDRFANKYLFCV